MPLYPIMFLEFCHESRCRYSTVWQCCLDQITGIYRTWCALIWTYVPPMSFVFRSSPSHAIGFVPRKHLRSHYCRYLPTTTLLLQPQLCIHFSPYCAHPPTHTHNHHDLPKMYAATRTPTFSLAPHLFVHSSDACLSHRIPTTRSTTTHPRRPPSADLAYTVLNHTFFFFAAAAEGEKDSCCCCEECSFFSFQCPCGHGAQRVEFFEESTRSCGIGGS